jgi:hypothetical protein
MVLFLLGAVLGCFLGIAVMCMFQLTGTVARREEEYFNSLERQSNAVNGGGYDGSKK